MVESVWTGTLATGRKAVENCGDWTTTVGSGHIGSTLEFNWIVYVGTTEQGIRRIAGSASRRVTQALEQLHGIKRLDAFVVWTPTIGLLGESGWRRAMASSAACSHQLGVRPSP